MNTQFFIVAISSIANLILAVLIVIHLRKTSSGRYLFWTILGLTGWILSNYYSNLHFSINTLFWLNKLIFFFTTIFCWGLAMFSVVFPEENIKRKKTVLFVHFLMLFILAISFSPYLVKNVIPRDEVTDLEFGWGMYLYSFFVLSCLIFAAIKIAYKYFSEKRKNIKNVMTILAFGILIFLVLAITTNLLLPLIFNIFSLSTLAPAYSSAFSFLMFLAILRYRFMNIKVIAAEMLTFVLWIALVIQLFLTESFAERAVGIVLLVIVIVFGYLLINSVKKEVERKEELQRLTEKLAAANEELKRLDNAKSEFISIASHQLRTPLTAIKGFVSLVLEGSYGEINPRVRDALTKVYGSGERLIHLVEDLLNVSRIESGRMEFKMEKTKIESILRELCDTFILVAKEKKLSLELKLPKRALTQIYVDNAKIREVISNLIDNALKYTPKGGVVIKAEMGICEGKNNHAHESAIASHDDADLKGKKVLRVIVSDTGIGIPSSEMPYLFGKFSRGKDTSRLHVGGTGLGLYVGKSIVEAHGGHIWAESDGGDKGSRFIIELPLSKKQNKK